MLDKKTHFKLASKVNKIMKDCQVIIPAAGLSDSEKGDLWVGNGFSLLTKSNIYHYSTSKTEQHTEELLELCKMLPIDDYTIEELLGRWELLNVSPRFKSLLKPELESTKGTVGIIAYADLIPETTSFDAQLKSFVIADHFINLLEAACIGAVFEYNKAVEKDGIKPVGFAIYSKYRQSFPQKFS